MWGGMAQRPQGPAYGHEARELRVQPGLESKLQTAGLGGGVREGPSVQSGSLGPEIGSCPHLWNVKLSKVLIAAI